MYSTDPVISVGTDNTGQFLCTAVNSVGPSLTASMVVEIRGEVVIGLLRLSLLFNIYPGWSCFDFLPAVFDPGKALTNHEVNGRDLTRFRFVVGIYNFPAPSLRAEVWRLEPARDCDSF